MAASSVKKQNVSLHCKLHCATIDFIFIDLFGILAASGDGGNVGRDELQFFCDAVEMVRHYFTLFVM